MVASRLIAHGFRTLFSIKDKNYTQFKVYQSRRELSLERDLLDGLVLDRVQRIIKYAELSSRYYKELFKENGFSSRSFDNIERLTEIPLLTREVLRERLADIIAGGTVLSSWRKSSTGGTTSSPVEFYCNRSAVAKKNAFSEVIDSWYGKKFGNRAAFLWGAPQDFSVEKSLGMKLRNLTYQKSMMLPSSPLDEEIMQKYLEKLNSWQPAFLQAYPTPLYEFCSFLKRQGVKLPYLKGASVTAESLHKYQREAIESVLDFKIFNWYGSRELGRVASECEFHDGFHINEPSVYVEVVPDPMLPSGYGHLVVTDLLNFATPLLRYQTGDIARVAEGDCQCGRVLKRISSLEGRLADTILLSGGRKVPGVSLACDFIKDSRELVAIQIVQKTLNSFVLRYVPGEKFSSETLNVFGGNLKDRLDENVTIAYEEVEEIPRTPSGKVRFVLSEISCAANA